MSERVIVNGEQNLPKNQWSKYLASGARKERLLKFVVSELKDNPFAHS